jgi:hypothetical protein
VILGATTSHKFQIVYGAASAVDLEVSGSVVVVSSASPPVFDGTNTGPFILASLTTAAGATADIVAGIASTKTRITECSVRNKDSSNSVTVTPRRTDGSQTTDGITVTLLPGEAYVYNGSIWMHMDSNGGLYPSVGNSATQAEMEAGTATNKYVTPQGVNWHPGACKAWAKHAFSGAVPQMSATWNVTSVTDSGPSRATPVIATDFSSANYAVTVSVEVASTTYSATTMCLIPVVRFGTQAAGTFTIDVVEIDIGQATDPAAVHWMAFGDQ